MAYRFSELKKKVVVNIKKGTILGRFGDVEFDAQTGAVIALIVMGKSRLFGLFGKCEDSIIPLCDIDMIGEDTVLVNQEPLRHRDRASCQY